MFSAARALLLSPYNPSVSGTSPTAPNGSPARPRAARETDDAGAINFLTEDSVSISEELPIRS
jgi:hypothetical protein